MAFTVFTQQQHTNAILAYLNSDPQVQSNLFLPDDLQIGSLERAHVEALGLSLEEQEQRMAQAVLTAISESCYTAFGFTLLPPQSSVGAILASTFAPVGSDIPIPMGWQVLASNGIIFQTTAAGSIPAGDLSSSLIPVIALTPGKKGDSPANSLSVPVVPIPGIDQVTNPTRTIGGFDEETKDARAIRFSRFIKSLSRGTKEALELAAYTASPAIVAAKSIEPFMLNPPPSGIPYAGLVWLFFDDGTGAALPVPPTGDPFYVAITQLVEGYTDINGNRIEGFKAAGCKVEVRRCPYAKIKLRGEVRVSPTGVGRWADIQIALTEAAQTYFSQLEINEAVSYQNLVTALTDCDPDLLQVSLYQWRETAPVPWLGSSMSGNPITFGSSEIGSRATLFQDSAPGPVVGQPYVSYPHWYLNV
jgi:hypothetical protein